MAQWSRVCVCVFWGQPVTSNASVLMIKGRPLASVISVWRRLKSSLHSLSVSCLDSTAVLSQHTKPPCYIMTAPHRASLAFCQPCVHTCVCAWVHLSFNLIPFDLSHARQSLQRKRGLFILFLQRKTGRHCPLLYVLPSLSSFI